MKSFKPTNLGGLIWLLFVAAVYLLSTDNFVVAMSFVIFFTIVLALTLCYLIYHSILSYYQAIIRSRQQSMLINSFTVIPYYELPSDIHPAIAGYLIDKSIGKRECLASLFSLIVNGNIAIDERSNNDKYQYYLIKNKGFDDKNSCDRFISDYLFYKNGIADDVVLFENIDIDMWERGQFAKYIIHEVISLGYFDDPFEYYYADSSTLLDPSKYIKILENNLKYSLYFTQQQRDHAKKEIEYYKTCQKEYDRCTKINNNAKFKHRIVKIKDSYYDRPMTYTKKGAEERAKWIGFRDYLQTAERFRMNEEKVETFSKYLPYAIALGVETQWAKRFEIMNMDRLDWFRTQKEGAIMRHDDHAVYFKHLMRFMGRIRTIN